jgi:hypothetical protein
VSRLFPLLPLLVLFACDQTSSTDTDVDIDTGYNPDCDLDSDGYESSECGGDDCDDADIARHPGAAELCDGVDNDCDGQARWEEDDGVQCQACDSAGYWQHIASVPAPKLRATLVEQTKGVRCSYRDATLKLFTQLDKHDGEVQGVYTGRTVAVGSDKPDSNLMNTEHTWPQSEGADREPAKCDLHHLYPAMASANNARGNLPFGVVTGSARWSDGGSKSSSTLFEPRDDHKGNVARAMLYFALRYDHDLSAPQRELYREWSAADPVNDADIDRTQTIERWQGHTNPFVVCAFLADDVTN